MITEDVTEDRDRKAKVVNERRIHWNHLINQTDSTEVTFNGPYGSDATQTSEHVECSTDLPRPAAKPEMTPTSQQHPNLLQGFYTQIMVNPMQLQEHEFTAWLERLVEARRNRQDKSNIHT